MDNTQLNIEIAALSREFAQANCTRGTRRSFPAGLWEKAVLLAMLNANCGGGSSSSSSDSDDDDSGSIIGGNPGDTPVFDEAVLDVDTLE